MQMMRKTKHFKNVEAVRERERERVTIYGNE